MSARGMSGERWRDLKDRGPIDRTHRAMPPSARRRPTSAPHTRMGPQRDTVGVARRRRHQQTPDGTWRLIYEPSPDQKLWHTTRPRPWDLKARRRVRSRIARRSRRANR